MALISIPRILLGDAFKANFTLSRMPKLFRIQSATMTSKENRDPDVEKPAPWPYETKKYTYWKTIYEGTMKRFDENTKIVIVDGPIGAGKSSFAKQLAEAFDFVYFPEPTMERYTKTAYGYDLRKINHLLPPSFKICDVGTYYANPHDKNVAKFQFRMYMFRLEQYIDALIHLLNTGQGVVLERCVYGDFVFAETMAKFGYLSPRVMKLYNDIQKNTLEELLRPHLIVYLDISPEVALERIKKRNDPVEVNSKVLTKDYLATIDHLYKQKYLKKMQKHAEVLVYDWTNFGDVEVVVEDIERIDFEKYTIYDNKMCDWQKSFDFEWNEKRLFYTNHKTEILNYGYIVRPSVEEVFCTGEEAEQFEKIILKIPGEKYVEEFNPDAGDSVLFKTKAKDKKNSVFYRLGD